MKTQFPFKLGCTSYIYPADILPNVRRLASWVNDIELIFYEWSDSTPPLTADSRQDLVELAQEHELSYTVHFPLYFPLQPEEPNRMQEYLAKISDIVEQTADLDPYAYILHLEGINFTSPTETYRQWQAAAYWLCEQIVCSHPIKAGLLRNTNSNLPVIDCFQKICIENLNYPLAWHANIVTDFGFSLCMDVGHLWKYQPLDWLSLIQEALPRTRVIHLHGEKEQQDHLSLKQSDQGRLMKLIETVLPHYRHILTLEVFNEQDFFESLNLVKQLWQN